MAKPSDKTFSSTGQTMADKNKAGGQKAGEASDHGAHYAASGQKSEFASKIREHMEVMGSCGNKVGVVDRVEGNAIKLTKNDSGDRQHHFIPLNWVQRVDNNQVRLTKNSREAQESWKPDAASCGCA